MDAEVLLRTDGYIPTLARYSNGKKNAPKEGRKEGSYPAPKDKQMVRPAKNKDGRGGARSKPPKLSVPRSVQLGIPQIHSKSGGTVNVAYIPALHASML